LLQSTLDEGDLEMHYSVWNEYSTQITLEANQSLLSAQNIPFYMWNIVFMEAYKKLNLLDTQISQITIVLWLETFLNVLNGEPIPTYCLY